MKISPFSPKNYPMMQPCGYSLLNEQYVNSTNSGFETYYERVADRAAKKDIRDYNYSYEKAYELIR